METIGWMEKYLGFATWISLAAGVLLGAASMMGCERPSTTEVNALENVVDAQLYYSALDECIQTSQTLRQSEICRCAVNLRWDRGCPDEITVKP